MNKLNSTFNVFLGFLFVHLIIWTLIPSLTNTNLPLDTIEALAWGSNLEWGFNKHPPLSAFAVEIIYRLFGNQDWSYYLLSQLFIVFSFFIIFKFSLKFFENEKLALISVIILEGIYFYNFTSPEFNVNISQLPFWALSIYYSWKCAKYNKSLDFILLGIFVALGILSKYLFVYLVAGIFTYLLIISKNSKKKIYLINCGLAFLTVILILLPHFIWLIENNYSTISYGLKRTGSENRELIDHFYHPGMFILKQIGLLIPFLLLILIINKKTKPKLRLKDKKLFFLFCVVLLPIAFIFLTSMIMGVKIRTMWMTPFYLFFGVFFIHILKTKINYKKLRLFNIVFIFLFIFSPLLYGYISVSKNDKRTDYPGKEIAYLIQKKWDENFINEISIIVGDEWSGGNLSYHLNSRPKWFNSLDGEVNKINPSAGIVYTGNPQVLKKVCPGVFGTIKPVGYCMIGQR